MFKNKVKELLRNGQPAIGTGIAVSDTFAVEVLAAAGYDWFFIDTEHCPIGTEALLRVLLAMKGSDTVPVVRLMNNHPDYFKMALDLGALGVVVPLIQSAEDARRAVDACRYPPAGTRGFGPVRVSQYHHQLKEYVARANDEILLVAQVETIQGVRELDAILEVEGIDAIFVGSGDLSSSLNHLGEFDHPEVKTAVTEVFTKAKRAGKPFGYWASTPEEFADYVKRGATLMLVGGDLQFVQEMGLDYAKRSRALLTAAATERP
jgi:2-keto-3-deoxy-L-rhamnonate aldolase RhmA